MKKNYLRIEPSAVDGWFATFMTYEEVCKEINEAVEEEEEDDDGHFEPNLITKEELDDVEDINDFYKNGFPRHAYIKITDVVKLRIKETVKSVEIE